MRLSFLGAAHEVTGSCHFIEACGKKILVDCGMQQGQDDDTQELPVVPADIDYLFLTHAHIDHSGKLPLLSKMGFNGKIFTTVATGELCSIMLQDSAHIQEFEAEWKNRKRQRAGEDLYEPLYTIEDAQRIMKRFVTFEYNQIISVCDGIKIRFIDVGHLLGSASIEVWIEEEDVSKKLVFSGDIGNLNQPLIRDPQYITEADYVVMESTYGDRFHSEERPDYIKELSGILQETFDRGGNVVIPSFAVGRTQEILYFLRKIKEEKLIKNHEDFPVYVDSPLAVEATGIFHKNELDCFDEDAMALVKKGINPIAFPGLRLSITSDESKAINFENTPKVILSASGMCEAGRIRHHLKHNLWRPECTILFVGYQAVGTLGRVLVEGIDEVKLFGEPIQVRASIKTLAGLSGHADKNGLIEWVSAFAEKPRRVFVVHGEDSVCKSFVECLQVEHGLKAYAPYSGTVFNLLTNKLEYEAQPIPVAKKKVRTGTDVFSRLLAAGQRLLTIIHKNEGCTNKDLAKFADQVTALCDKWDRDI